MKNINFKLLIISIFFISSYCTNQEFSKTPIDKMIIEMEKIPMFTILLADMDIEDGFLSDTYKHKYKIITEIDDSIQNKTTDWVKVDEYFFQYHINDLGMEICSKKDKKISKTASPAGFSNYIGNEKYGEWKQNSDGTQFWGFYGRYMFLSSMMNMAMMPTYASYNTYGRYRGTRPYYGNVNKTTGVRQYGTHSPSSSNKKTSFNKKMTSSNNFKNKVGNQVSRSSSVSKSGKRSTRSGSRYGSKSRSRSYSLGGK